MHTKHALWYLPVRRPSADEMLLPVMARPHALQSPRWAPGSRDPLRDGGAARGEGGEVPIRRLSILGRCWRAGPKSCCSCCGDEAKRGEGAGRSYDPGNSPFWIAGSWRSRGEIP